MNLCFFLDIHFIIENKDSNAAILVQEYAVNSSIIHVSHRKILITSQSAAIENLKNQTTRFFL